MTEEKSTNKSQEAAKGSPPEEQNYPEIFFRCFVEEMKRDGYTPEQMCRYTWKPFQPEDLKIKGPDRDMTFSKVETSPADIRKALDQGPFPGIDAKTFFQDQKLVLLLLPGYTHHTLKYPAFIAQEEGLKKSSLDVVKLYDGDGGGSSREEVLHRGGGVKLAYVAYPRSNACSEVIGEPLFNVLDRSRSLKRWVIEEGRKIVFIGYSYGAPLSLELLAALNTKRYNDSFILRNTLALLMLNGDVRGSYLADVVTNPKGKFNVQKYVALAKIFPPLGYPMGLKTKQERDDNVGGAISLGHADRGAHLAEYMDKVPENIKYLSMCAFLPEADYENGIFKNFDDWIMHKQSLASKPVSIYNDGQMVLEDCYIPEFPKVPKENRIHLGAVRSHHWGISWITFNAGKNKFPKFPYYRALARTLHAAGLGQQ